MRREIGELGDFIRVQRKKSALSVRKLAERAGVSNPYLSQIERGLRQPSAEILRGIARALSLSAETLYVRAGLLEGHERIPGVPEAIESDGKLNLRQRQALIEVYRSFVDGVAPVKPAPKPKATKPTPNQKKESHAKQTKQ